MQERFFVCITFIRIFLYQVRYNNVKTAYLNENNRCYLRKNYVGHYSNKCIFLVLRVTNIAEVAYCKPQFYLHRSYYPVLHRKHLIALRTYVYLFNIYNQSLNGDWSCINATISILFLTRRVRSSKDFIFVIFIDTLIIATNTIFIY